MAHSVTHQLELYCPLWSEYVLPSVKSVMTAYRYLRFLQSVLRFDFLRLIYYSLDSSSLKASRMLSTNAEQLKDRLMRKV